MAEASTDADVTLEFPAEVTHVRLARLVASGLGTEMGFDVDAIEDLRLAVDEACAVMLECCVPTADRRDMLDIRFHRSRDSLTVRVKRREVIVTQSPSAVSVSILDTVSADWRFEHCGSDAGMLVTVAGVPR